MNAILVPVDFSETSDNALLYAVNLANYLSANLVLFHVNVIPIYNNEYGTVTYSENESVENTLNLLRQSLFIKKDNVLIGNVDCHVEVGDFKSQMIDYVDNNNIDMVVMGITGHSTKIGQVLFGSNAISISRESNIPVFILLKIVLSKK